MKEIKAFIRPELLEDVLEPLYAHPEFPGLTISTVHGFGHKVGRENSSEFGNVQMIKLETIVPDALLDEVLTLIRERASTGRRGDGKIAVYNVEAAIRISTGKAIEE
ncbi:MAG: P-II family nitrogen regulator [Candidatus Hydrogenedentes bacterium]|nr:P-II family nitrogen regulator [Candidatus Hydrogenedentota bacterium]